MRFHDSHNVPHPRCGVKYHSGILPPKWAKFAVYFWAFVVYHSGRSAAESTLGRLSYYEAEDAQVIDLSKQKGVIYAIPHRSRVRNRSRTRSRPR